MRRTRLGLRLAERLLFFVVTMDTGLQTESGAFLPPCSHWKPVQLLEKGVPTLHKLPAGVSVLYDTESHVHAFQFSRDASGIAFPADRIFLNCAFFPYEFSIFLSLKVSQQDRQSAGREQCIVALYDAGLQTRIMSLTLSPGKMTFQFKDKHYKFKTNVYSDGRWHTYGLSMSADTLSMTTDCSVPRERVVRAPFPNFLHLTNTSFSIGRCTQPRTVFQGLLKDLILIAGADASARACPPRVQLQQNPETFIKTFTGYGPLTHLRLSPGQCEWTDVGNIAFDVFASKLKVCINGLWQEMTIQTAKTRLDYVVHHQLLETGAASLDVEIFDIPGEGKFVAFANAETSTGKPSTSSIFKWENEKFQLYQRLQTKGAQSWEFFEINGQFFLAVANFGHSDTEQCNSTIYKWRRSQKKFQSYQYILTWTARDVEYFFIQDQHYLAVANHAQDGKTLIDSIIYKWDGAAQLFREHQRILTVGAYDWTHFQANGFHFLVVANAFNGITTLIDSALYLFQNGNFVQFQTMETNGATDWEFVTIGKDIYLAVANAYNYGSQNYLNTDNYATNSTIYRLNQAKRVFEKYQSIPTFSAIDWHHMKIGSDHYLIVSNAQNGGTGERLKSVIYHWQGVGGFVPVHSMITHPNSDFDVFTHNNNVYLIYASAKSSISEVLKVKLV